MTNWGNNINCIFMMDQHLPPLQNNILTDWGNNISFIFMRDQNSPAIQNLTQLCIVLVIVFSIQELNA